MSLDYDLRKVKHSDWIGKTEEAERERAKLTTIVFGCIPVKMGEITEANADEWYERYVIWYRLDVGGKCPITRTDVHRYIGLRTNAFGDEKTHLQWVRWVVEQAIKDLKREKVDERASA